MLKGLWIDFESLLGKGTGLKIGHEETAFILASLPVRLIKTFMYEALTGLFVPLPKSPFQVIGKFDSFLF